ncbi:hypothetical protein Hanom_Chr12g01176921 [Helianthus anomalus]
MFALMLKVLLVTPNLCVFQKMVGKSLFFSYVITFQIIFLKNIFIFKSFL